MLPNEKNLLHERCASQIVGRIWNNLRCIFVTLTEDDYSNMLDPAIPREDIGIYLTARNGAAECFVSSNHELVQALARKSGAFECLSPVDFIKKYIHS